MEHKKEIVGWFNKFKASRGKKIETQKAFFEKLNLTLKIVFKKEEGQYEQCGYPDLKLHKSIHEEFSRTLASFNHEYFVSCEDQTQIKFNQLIEYIDLWLQDHQKADRAALSFVRIYNYCENYE